MPTSHSPSLTDHCLWNTKQSSPTSRNTALSGERVTLHPFHRADLTAPEWAEHPVKGGKPGRKGNYRSD